MSGGFFISFEGGEGAGKSTQVRRLAERLKVAGREVVTTREPGGSAGAEAVRALLVTGPADRWSPLAETMLLQAARSDHLDRLIRPALARGAVVICDRFLDSTRAYQGAAGGVPPELISDLERHVVSSTYPDLTVILDLPVEQGLARAGRRGEGEARFEAKGLDFHNRLRAAFTAIAQAEPARCILIDGAAPAETVEATVWEQVRARLSP